jgi:hypothetical protein
MIKKTFSRNFLKARGSGIIDAFERIKMGKLNKGKIPLNIHLFYST